MVKVPFEMLDSMAVRTVESTRHQRDRSFTSRIFRRRMAAEVWRVYSADWMTERRSWEDRDRVLVMRIIPAVSRVNRTARASTRACIPNRTAPVLCVYAISMPPYNKINLSYHQKNRRVKWRRTENPSRCTNMPREKKTCFLKNYIFSRNRRETQRDFTGRASNTPFRTAK